MTPEQVTEAAVLLSDRRQVHAAFDSLNAFRARYPYLTALHAKSAPGHGNFTCYVPPQCEEEAARQVYAALTRVLEQRYEELTTLLNNLGVTP